MKLYSKKILNITRLSMGFIFLWAFLDKTFGLGFATAGENAWIAGGSPTTGFLMHGTRGPLASFFQSLAGNGIVDWLFMLGLLFVGVSFLINRYLRWGAIAGIALMILMYLAALWPENNPFMDDHLIYALIMCYIALKGRS